MKNYNIYFGNRLVIEGITGTEFAWEVYEKAKELAELVGEEAALVWVATGEVIAHSDDWDDCDSDYEPQDIDYDCGFDPYMGCFSDDC